MPEVGLEVAGVRHTYGEGALVVRALDGVTAAFCAGRLHLVMGPSGSGKTTLLSILGCLLTPEGGEVRLLGRTVSGLSGEVRAELRRRHIGFVFQAFRLFRALSALENVLVTLELEGRRGGEAEEAAAAALRRVGLGDKVHRRPHELSGGEKQRVALARALVKNPEIVLADEPTASLDGTSGLQVVEELRRLAVDQNRVVVVVSHDPRLLPYAHHVLTLENGQIAATEERCA